MKVLMLEWNSFGKQDITDAFLALGHQVKCVPIPDSCPREDKELQQLLVSEIHTYSPDFVFSFNYFPLVSLACKEADMRYVAWIYDSPYVMLYSYTTLYPRNYIFVFDKELYLEFHNAGITTVYYLPMAANPQRLSSMITDTALKNFANNPVKNQTDIAFVGSLYTEKHQFYQRLDGILPYTRGYLESIMHAQQKVYGYNFIEELLTPEIIHDMKRILPLEPNADGIESSEYLYSQYVINRQITALERTALLSAIGEKYSYDLYTPNEEVNLAGCINHGTVDYYEVAPFVFHCAKINLNITLRSIKSGIPLRAFEIMGAGGFLLTNYQADFLDEFIPNVDFVYFESKDDLLYKLTYYLEHDRERSEIAANGLQKVAAAHTYEHRIAEILSVLGK